MQPGDPGRRDSRCRTELAFLCARLFLVRRPDRRFRNLMGHRACNRQGAVTVQPLDTGRWRRALRAARLLVGSAAQLAWVAAAAAGVAVAGGTASALAAGSPVPAWAPQLTVIARAVGQAGRGPWPWRVTAVLTRRVKALTWRRPVVSPLARAASGCLGEDAGRLPASDARVPSGAIEVGPRVTGAGRRRARLPDGRRRHDGG
jgi:hypothetical protein